MKIKIFNKDNPLAIPADFEIEVSYKNPIFSKEGSGTFPIALPPTANNFADFGFPNRLDSKKIHLSHRIQVQNGIYQRIGTATILDASDENINIQIGFDEGEFWNKINDIKLNELNWETVNYGSVKNAISVMNNLLTRKTENEDLAVFEVMLDVASKDGRLERYKVNDINRLNGTWGLKNQSIWYEHILVDNEWTYKDGIKLPIGYGISPFLRVSALLEKMFASFGYKVILNPFKEGQLKNLVILNNTRDSIVTGSLKYSDLVPTCTVNELLDTLMAKFGAVVYVNSNDMTVSIRLIKDILAQPAQVDLTNFQNTKFKIYYEKGKQLKLSSAKSIKSDHVLATAKTEFDTWEEFVSFYTNKFNIINNTREQMSTDGIYSVFVFCRSTNQFYSWNLKQNGQTHYNIFSSGFFDWDQKTPNLDYEELKGVDEQVPMVSSNDTNDFALDIPAFLVGVRNKNTMLSIKNDNSGKGNEVESECPLAFCWVNTANEGVSFGTSFRATPLQGGATDIEIDLCYNGEHGLFNNFMKEYDIYLRYGLKKVESTYMLDEFVEQNLDITQPVLSHNQRFLIEDINAIIGKKVPTQMTLRSATIYGNHENDYIFTPIEQATEYLKFYNELYERDNSDLGANPGILPRIIRKLDLGEINQGIDYDSIITAAHNTDAIKSEEFWKVIKPPGTYLHGMTSTYPWNVWINPVWEPDIISNCIVLGSKPEEDVYDPIVLKNKQDMLSDYTAIIGLQLSKEPDKLDGYFTPFTMKGGGETKGFHYNSLDRKNIMGTYTINYGTNGEFRGTSNVRIFLFVSYKAGLKLATIPGI